MPPHRDSAALSADDGRARRCRGVATMTTNIRNYETADPRLKDFYNDMNEHNARYGRVLDGGETYVLELERFPERPRGRNVGQFRLTIWKAVKQQSDTDRYARPDIEGNRYAWDAVGRKTYDDEEEGPDAAQRAFRRLKDGSDDVAEWCDAHPYDGPRSPFHDN